MKKYIAIGHFKENENMTSAAMESENRKNFEYELKRNGFVAWAVIGRRKMEVIKETINQGFGLWEEVKKLTTNYRRWDDIYDYIEQCIDIMEEKIESC